MILELKFPYIPHILSTPGWLSAFRMTRPRATESMQSLGRDDFLNRGLGLHGIYAVGLFGSRYILNILYVYIDTNTNTHIFIYI